MVVRTVLVVILTLFGLWVLNILVGLGRAGQADRTSHVLSILGQTQMMRSSVEAHFRGQGRFPDSNAELGIGPPGSWLGKGFRSVTVEQGGTLRLAFEAPFEGATIVQRPGINLTGIGPQFNWECFAYGLDPAIVEATRGRPVACTRLEEGTPLPKSLYSEATADTLLVVVSNGSEPHVRYLIDQKVEVDGIPQGAKTPVIFRAIEGGKTKIVQMLVEAGADVRFANPDNGVTPLMFAAQQGNARPDVMLPMLLEAGAELEARDLDGKTALMHAAAHGRTDAVRYLVEAGADVMAVDKRGSKASVHALAAGRGSAAYDYLWNAEIKAKQGPEFVYRLPENN